MVKRKMWHTDFNAVSLLQFVPVCADVVDEHCVLVVTLQVRAVPLKQDLQDTT